VSSSDAPHDKWWKSTLGLSSQPIIISSSDGVSLLPRRDLQHRSLGNADGRLPTSLPRHSHPSVADKAHHRSPLSREDTATFNNRPQTTTDNGNRLQRGTCFEVRACNTDTDILTFNTRSAKDEMSIAVTRPSSLSIYQNLQHQPASWAKHLNRRSLRKPQAYRAPARTETNCHK